MVLWHQGFFSVRYSVILIKKCRILVLEMHAVHCIILYIFALRDQYQKVHCGKQYWIIAYLKQFESLIPNYCSVKTQKPVQWIFLRQFTCKFWKNITKNTQFKFGIAVFGILPFFGALFGIWVFFSAVLRYWDPIYAPLINKKIDCEWRVYKLQCKLANNGQLKFYSGMLFCSLANHCR